MRRLLLDAGILIRIAYEHDPLSPRVLSRVRELTREGWDLCLAPQGSRESLNALTRPTENGGYGLPSESALEALRRLETSFTLLPDSLSVFRRWQTLVAKYAITGKSVHDANMIAAALTHGATHILTLSERDFRRYEEVGVLPVVARWFVLVENVPSIDTPPPAQSIWRLRGSLGHQVAQQCAACRIPS